MMDSIRKRHGSTIAAACDSSSVRPDFVAALCGNESSGDERAVRFEPSVFAKLLEVCAGKRAEYKPAGIKAALGAQDLLTVIGQRNVTNPSMDAGLVSFSEQLKTATFLATSHGLTQIMGWHCIEFGRHFGILGTPAGQLRFTIELLTWFAHLYNLDLATADADLLRCWNTGRPDGLTYDSQYVIKATRRSEIYRELTAAPSGVIT